MDVIPSRPAPSGSGVSTETEKTERKIYRNVYSTVELSQQLFVYLSLIYGALVFEGPTLFPLGKRQKCSFLNRDIIYLIGNHALKFIL